MKSKFPSGTVTFLFTDIEDSTKLWETAPEKMHIALPRHLNILREAIESNGGIAFQIIGDAFCAAFSTAQSAISAAVTVQRNLHQEVWDLPFPIRVRMGIHTGEAVPDSNDPLTGGYASNQTLNRVARILGAGHGGQILLSLTTRELVKGSLPANTQLRDMGEHQLKNLSNPEHLYQLTIAGPPSDFPPLNTPDPQRHKATTQLTSFIGLEKTNTIEFLERASQLQALDSALAYARSGQGCVALVYGEAGIGKTSLVDAFARENKKSLRILSGACDSLFTPRPLGPLHDIASQTQGSLGALLEAESNRTAIFSVCLSELNTQSTILVIEDVHWADEATLDLLKYLGRRIKQTTSLMILTYRDDEIGPDHPLRLLLGDLASSHALHRVPVPWLSKDAVQNLAKGKNINSLELHRMTNGNPFFVTEVLAGEGGIPVTVRDAVLARAARLSASARRVLDVAAVIGLRAEAWLLSEMAGAEFANVEECGAKGMLQVQGDTYAFRHELARQTILESMSPQRKITLHRMILNALKESPETCNDFARLADHSKGAKDAKAVLEYAPAAARQASALGAHRQAAAHYKTALQYVGMSAPELRAKLLDAYSDECSLLNQRTEAKGAQEEALEIWQELGQREREGRAYRRLSEIDHEYLFGPEREQYVAHAIELLETLPPSKELARAYGQMARVHMSFNKASGADPIYWGSRALELAEQFDDVEILIHALNSIGTWEMAIGKHAEGKAKLERSLQLSLNHGFQFLVARSLTNLSVQLMDARDYAASLRYIDKGIEYCIQHDLDYWLEYFQIDRTMVRFRQGYWAEAEQDAKNFLAIKNKPELYTDMPLILLRIRARLGEPLSSEALDTLDKYIPKTNDVNTRCEYAVFFAEYAWLKGDLAQCGAEAEPTYKAVLQLNYKPDSVHDSGFSELSYYLWRAGAITEPLAIVIEPYASQIRGDWQAAASMWEKFGCPYEHGMALMDGDKTAQLAALEIFERLGARPIIEILKKQMRAQGIRIPRGARPATRENPYGLTAREIEVLSCLTNGLSNHAIAKQLSLSPRTVEHHISSVLQKMGVQSRNEAVARALKDKMFPSE